MRINLNKSFFSMFLLASGSGYAQEIQTNSSSTLQAINICSSILNNEERLSCFDELSNTSKKSNTPSASMRNWDESGQHNQKVIVVENNDDFHAGEGCKNPEFDSISRFFELSKDTDCGNFKLRGYHPQSLTATYSNRVNNSPHSPKQHLENNEENKKEEVRFQVSLRTKLASGIFTNKESNALDSLWAAYTQESYWQIFNKKDSNPFRSTDYKPEFFYVYPLSYQLPGEWRLRYFGVGYQHHSNGQRDPLSRSWNNAYIMAGADYKDKWIFTLKTWRSFSPITKNKDNKDIEEYWGRVEAKIGWNVNFRNSLVLSARGSVSKSHANARLEWFHALGPEWFGQKSNLQFYTRLNTGYGESLIDYNFKRTTLSVGLSLLDF